MDEAEADLQHACEAPEVQLFPMLSYGHISGNRFLERFRDAERRHPVRAVWDPTLKLPTQLIEYISAVCADLAPQVRQEAILLLKRYVHSINSTGNCPKKLPDLQVVGLTCANLAIKHGQQRGIPERKLHWLSRNAFTREDFIDAELDVLQALNCSICWEAALIAEWTALLLYLSSPLLAEAADVKTIGGVQLLAFRTRGRFNSRGCRALHQALPAAVADAPRRPSRWCARRPNGAALRAHLECGHRFALCRVYHRGQRLHRLGGERLGGVAAGVALPEPDRLS
eukprot:gnl/TRDRNA2_/TRDRNA2_91892_c0_seq2.p1 gnl/TRDRNA2_/TRDRNA2_91892_c0~~gnl/TRDRNA2_/TRDRNA2_91892_c0_seq2.p1  ORF type:complete len:311 (+),score=45.74 gnl/TRDRNA2_/TRDRNA2_91892_c0_seq2:82-933(+)